MKVYWLAKSVDWSVNISRPSASQTITGSGTIDLTCRGVLPAARAVNANPTGYPIGPGKYPLSGTPLTNTLGGSSYGATFYLSFFDDQTVGGDGTGSIVPVADSPSLYQANFLFSFAVGGAGYSTVSYPYTTPNPSSVPLNVTIDGDTYTVQLFRDSIPGDDSGSIEFNFNSFFS